MGQVFKVAAGVLIGLLAYQVIIYLNMDYQLSRYQEQIASQQAEYEAQINKQRDERALRKYFTRLTSSIASYYRKNNALPEYISDLRCVESYKNKTRMDCAEVYEDGVFYVSHGGEWASAEPYVLDGKLFNKCKASIPLSIGNDMYEDCKKLDINSVPEKKMPPFECNEAAGDVEKIICASDKLIAHEVKLWSTYKALLEQNPADKKRLIIDDRSRFMSLRRRTCVTSDCIEEMTMKKILRLEFLGVWKKEG